MPDDRRGFTAGHLRQFVLIAALASSVMGCAATTNVATAPKKRATADLATSSLVSAKAAHDEAVARLKSKSFDGIASFYWEGSRVATGARFEPNGFTAAHRWLPFGTRLRITDPKTGRSVVVVVNDRGPFVPGRVLDLSLGAAHALGIEGRGINRVHADVL